MHFDINTTRPRQQMHMMICSLLRPVGQSMSKMGMNGQKQASYCSMIENLIRNHNEEKRYLMISANNITLRVGKKALFEDVNINLPKATATV